LYETVQSFGWTNIEQFADFFTTKRGDCAQICNKASCRLLFCISLRTVPGPYYFDVVD